jgi:uncharacterized membrane protein YagU involved in acid resistance
LLTSSNSRRALLWAGLLCGILDITAAFVVYGLLYRVKPGRILQGIASGLLGSNAFGGGVATELLGLVCHFVIAFGAAAVYLLVSHGISFLIQHAVIAGALYGVAVYFFMNLVVVPLSAAGPRPFSFRAMLIGIVIHIFCVGLPISLTIRRFVASA